ncbi:MAG: RnfH family protein [Steroidobacteraceae bacterium]|nr:RnfH family protein [Steroidobacteraceae bacterium]
MPLGGALTRCFVALERIRIQVACAEAGRQTVLELELDAGCTAGEALLSSGIFAMHPDIGASGCGIGIFGREVPRDHRLQDGDRLEVLRPLMEDPRERRRRLANQGRTGKKSGGGG